MLRGAAMHWIIFPVNLYIARHVEVSWDLPPYNISKIIKSNDFIGIYVLTNFKTMIFKKL